MMARAYVIVGSWLILSITLAAQISPDFDAIVKNADAVRDAGNTDKAIALYQQALRMKPDWRQGWWVLGSVLYDANRFSDANQAFLPLTQLDPDKSAGWAMSGLCEFETKHYTDALTHLQKAETIGLPQSLFDVAHYHIELILIVTGQFDAALEILSRYALGGGDNPKVVEAMGIAALRRAILPGDIPAADNDLVMAVGQAVRDGAANHIKDATSDFEALLTKYPQLPELHYLAGMVLLQSDPDKALGAFQQELQLSPKHPQTLVSLAAEYLKRNDYQIARTYAEKAVDCAPHYFAAHAILGKVLIEGDLDSARGIKELESAVAMAPANPQSRLSLASAYARVGRNTDAAKQRAEFLRLRTEIDASNSGQK